jgi:type II secretory pathway pseudopilin PulG
VELTVVIAVLAILATVLLPRIAFIRTMTLHASAATSIQEINNNMLTFHATQARWPHRFDSLLTGTSGGAPTGLYGSGGGAQGLDSTINAGMLTKVTLTSAQLKSLSGLLGNPNGNTTLMEVMDHDESITKPGNSGVYPRDLNSSGADLSVLSVNATHNVNPSDPNAASGSIVYNSVFPNGNPNNEIIVAMGVGPSCTAVSKTIVNPPLCYLKDGTRYNRIIVLLRVRPDGVQASLAGAISPDGRTLDQCLGNYRTTAER